MISKKNNHIETETDKTLRDAYKSLSASSSSRGDRAIYPLTKDRTVNNKIDKELRKVNA